MTVTTQHQLHMPTGNVHYTTEYCLSTHAIKGHMLRGWTQRSMRAKEMAGRDVLPAKLVKSD